MNLDYISIKMIKHPKYWTNLGKMTINFNCTELKDYAKLPNMNYGLWQDYGWDYGFLQIR